MLRLLIDEHNKLFSLWLRSYNHHDRQKYLTQRRLVAHKVWERKNRWYQGKVKSIQAALSQGRPSVVWQDIHAICNGLQPVQPRTVRKLAALSRIKVGKAAGSNGLFPYIVKCWVALCWTS